MSTTGTCALSPTSLLISHQVGWHILFFLRFQENIFESRSRCGSKEHTLASTAATTPDSWRTSGRHAAECQSALYSSPNALLASSHETTHLSTPAGPAVRIPNSHGNLGIGIGIFTCPGIFTELKRFSGDHALGWTSVGYSLGALWMLP